MPVRGKMNFLGSRVSASESGGTTTVNVESVGSTEHLVQRFLNNAGSMPQTGSTVNFGASDGPVLDFIDQGGSDLANGEVVFAEPGLYHFTYELYLTSGVVWTSQTSWPKFDFVVFTAGVSYDQLFTFRYHYPASSPQAYAHVNTTEFMDTGDYFAISRSMPTTWTTRSYTSKVLIARVA
jgi:hypothetical protein